jgi:phosphate:Na+ symporter
VGAHIAQTGIQRTFGSKLRPILGEALKTGFLAGMGVTAVLQCSTAPRWMVSGFAAGVCRQPMIVETPHAGTGK